MDVDTHDELARLTEERERVLENLGSLDRDESALSESQAGREVRVDGASGDGDHLSVERGAIKTMRNRLEARLAELDQGLAELADGSYGHCEVCGEAIDPERLEALPGCRECMGCKLAGRAR